MIVTILRAAEPRTGSLIIMYYYEDNPYDTWLVFENRPRVIPTETFEVNKLWEKL